MGNEAYLICLLFETALLSAGVNLDEPTQFGGLIHRMIKFGLSIDDADEGRDDDESLHCLEGFNGAADEASKNGFQIPSRCFGYD